MQPPGYTGGVAMTIASDIAYAVIPARSGSVRIPRKNLANFGGEPAISLAIKIARDSSVFSRIIVSTDDEEIASCASRSGAEIIWRPKELCDSFTPLQPVVKHAIEHSPYADLICLVLATAVFLDPNRLRYAYEILKKDARLDYAIGISRFESPPQRALVRNSDGCISMQSPEYLLSRSQDMPNLYHDAGQFSFGRKQAWLSDRHSFVANTYGIELGRLEAIDIDVPEDLEFAQRIFDLRSVL